MDQTCKNDLKPVYSKGLCQQCYDRQKSSARNYKKAECRNGHPFVEGSFETSTSNKRLCLICKEENKKTHCPQGHEYVKDNIYMVNGSPQCKICRNQRMRDRRPARGIGAGGVNKAKTHCPQGHEYSEENTLQNKDGRRGCRACANTNSRIQRVKAHGITPEQYEELLIAQDYRCPGCNEVLEDRSGQAIDHDHVCCPEVFSCGRCIRGILCKSCNTVLGFAKDRSETLRNLADYLEK